jgi:tetratricopeptide (TPR) repeat protein
MPDRLAKKILLIGWDAADWQVILPLLKAGQMPCLQRVIQNGVRANLQTLSPMVSPLLWNSVATGKRADKHGILNFVELDPNGRGVRPVTSTSRRVKAIWNILTQQGLRTHVVAWFASHPAEPINGVCVSNVFTAPVGGRDKPWPIPTGSVHPEHLEATLAALRIHPGEIVARQMLPFVPRLPAMDMKDRRLVPLAVALAQCSSIQRVVAWILDNEPGDFVAAYFNAIDHVSHHFMAYHPPRRPEIPEADFQNFQDVIASTYRYHDYMLAGLLHRAGPDTTVIVLSDHGFQSGDLRPPGPATLELDRPVDWHRPMGILSMAGPGIKRNTVVTSATLLDITPTVLTLFGLPVAEDMEGRPLMEALTTAAEPARIPSWEDVPGQCGMHPRDQRVESWDAQQALAQLAALGYIEGAGPDEERAVRVARLQEKLNLALVYLGTERPAEAAPLFEELMQEEPGEMSFPVFLARCRLALREFAECRRLGQVVLGQKPDDADAALVLGKLCLAEDRAVEAIEHLVKAERSNPSLAELHVSMATAYMSQERWADAERAFRKALVVDGDTARAYLGLAQACLAQKRFAAAADESLRAIRLDDGLAFAHYCLGVAFLNMNKKDQARKALERCLQLDPSHSEARKHLADLEPKNADPS